VSSIGSSWAIGCGCVERAKIQSGQIWRRRSMCQFFAPLNKAGNHCKSNKTYPRLTGPMMTHPTTNGASIHLLHILSLTSPNDVLHKLSITARILSGKGVRMLFLFMPMITARVVCVLLRGGEGRMSNKCIENQRRAPQPNGKAKPSVTVRLSIGASDNSNRKWRLPTLSLLQCQTKGLLCKVLCVSHFYTFYFLG